MSKKVILSLLAAVAVLAISGLAFAQGTEDVSVTVERIAAGKWIAIAAGFGIAIAAFGGSLGQGRTASTALDAIARNPGAADKVFTPMILGLALIESLVIYALIISFILSGKIA